VSLRRFAARRSKNPERLARSFNSSSPPTAAVLTSSRTHQTNGTSCSRLRPAAARLRPEWPAPDTPRPRPASHRYPPVISAAVLCMLPWPRGPVRLRQLGISRGQVESVKRGRKCSANRIRPPRRPSFGADGVAEPLVEGGLFASVHVAACSSREPRAVGHAPWRWEMTSDV